MKITIDIDNYSADFDYIVDLIADELKKGNMNGDAETDGCVYSWRTEQDED